MSGIDTSDEHGDAFALAELKRLAGHVLLRQDRHDEARRAFESAVEIAYRQEARLYLLQPVAIWRGLSPTTARPAPLGTFCRR